MTLVLAVVWMGYLGLRWSSLVRIGRSGDREILDDGAVDCVGHIFEVLRVYSIPRDYIHRPFPSYQIEYRGALAAESVYR